MATSNRGSPLGRRGFLTGGAALAGGVVGFGVSDRTASSSSPDRAALADSRAVGDATEPFYGDRQAGVTTAPQAHAVFLAFDLSKDAHRDNLTGVLRTWSHDAARLARGRSGLADLQPELAESPARLTVTIGFGPDLLDKVGLGDRNPQWLRPLPAFPQIDRLEDRWSGGDLLLQICADDPLTVAHAARVLASGVRGVVTQRWAQRGFRRAVGTDPSGRTQRNLFGQLDGTVNPAPEESDFEALLFSDGADRPWMRGGTSLVLRRIRMTMNTWEEIDRNSRELSVGRKLDSGAPLTGTVEHDPADFTAMNEVGLTVIPAESHIARAHSSNRSETILRRPYNYDDTPQPGQISNSGLLFAAYQADPVRQYLPIQQRLAEQDMLNTWTVPIGSAVFAIPPGCQEGGYIGQGALEG
ncbi:Dyp-type peroxidase [Dietzia aurantiaca]|uniref:Dyp-type peroxidase n=1 Tax=Dietzia aurantiaca TaxID=983873 RepID=UPI001E35C785|nr:Dyp-type peroxidase [Dietzia aurantiaca]MCD2264398.1 Dyp-type peroxidase [Dietzia aurantiaca]